MFGFPLQSDTDRRVYARPRFTQLNYSSFLAPSQIAMCANCVFRVNDCYSIITPLNRQPKNQGRER
ncbi:Uncharacterized protein APZ42_017902 [Daphnia magna]|uniref:Uncharacterized protein n=1 Tax=Daphnia magna TaxID=35525 RepID=A0A0P6J1B7_9CRUS|nr:Uncharacterized protein APZ42_017902 [Daphnia magna]